MGQLVLFSLIHPSLSAAEPGALLSSHTYGVNMPLTGGIRCGLISFVTQIMTGTDLPISELGPLTGSPSYVNDSPRCSLKDVLKEVSLLFLLHSPACPPSALHRSVPMGNTLPHSPTKAGLQILTGYYWRFRDNKQNYLAENGYWWHCGWLFSTQRPRPSLRFRATSPPLQLPTTENPLGLSVLFRSPGPHSH